MKFLCFYQNCSSPIAPSLRMRKKGHRAPVKNKQHLLWYYWNSSNQYLISVEKILVVIDWNINKVQNFHLRDSPANWFEKVKKRKWYDSWIKAEFSEQKLNLMPFFKCFVLNALCSIAKRLKIVIRHGIRPDFLEIHLLIDIAIFLHFVVFSKNIKVSKTLIMKIERNYIN